MEKRMLLSGKLRFLIAALTVSIFTCQAFGGNSKNPKPIQKPQVQKTTVKKTVPTRIINPKVNPSSFTPDMPLEEAIDILRNTTIPPLNIAVMWRDLDAHADITRNTPIGMDGVSGVSLKTQLNLLMMSLSAGSAAPLGYVVEDSVIIIATKDFLPVNKVTRVYNIADLVAPPSMAGMMPRMGIGMGMMPYGNMMPYGVGNLAATQQYGNTNYQNRGYPNQPIQNQTQTTSNIQATPMGISR